MKILVTGSSGFIGTNLVNKIKKESLGYVYGIDKNPPQNTNILPDKFILEDISSECFVENMISSLCSEVDTIYHLAAQTSGRVSEESPRSDCFANCVGFSQVLQLAEKISKNQKYPPKIIFTSSMAVYGSELVPFNENSQLSPTSTYGASKVFGEMLLKKYANQGGSWNAIRLFNCYGPWQDMENHTQGMVSIFVQQAITKKEFFVTGSLERTRDFIYIDDVIRIITSPNFLRLKNEIVNLCTGRETTVKTLIEKIANVYGISNEDVTISQLESHSGDMHRSVGCTQKLLNCLGQQKFTSLDEGLKSFKEFLDGK
ncbi:NAD-dependent epimerase/dehydratase family protein [Planktomarina temperata]|nr:NAD-dependent epimerase/dehydratase family protein [Planktomarina temperata]